MLIARSVLLFALAGVAEIGGGYLMWLWLREGRPLWVGIVGAGVVLYGVIVSGRHIMALARSW